MNMFAINEACEPSRGRRLATAWGALFGAAVMVGPALAADLPMNYNNYNNFDSYQTPCCNNYYPPPCCNSFDKGPWWWGPAVNVHVNVPWERRGDAGWVSRNFVERRYSDFSPYPEFRQYRSVSRYRRLDSDRFADTREDVGQFGPPPAPAAFEGRDPYRYADGPPPYDYRSEYHRRSVEEEDALDRAAPRWSGD